jgi:DNA-binding transcriptional LysR family regulator
LLSIDPLHAPDFTLRQLSFLLASAEEGSISAAAARLHVSSSAISDAITELESSVGTRLCVRRRAHGLTLTPAGERVVVDARRMLRAARELSATLRSEPGILVGPIRIGCYPTLAPVILPVLLSDFGALHPAVELSIVEATHDQLAGRLETGEVDVAFIYDTLIPGHPRRAPLFALPAHVLLPAGHPLAGTGSVSLEDLVSDDLILLDVPPSSDHTLEMFAARGLVPRIRHRTTSYEAVRTLVGRGLGYGVLVQRPANSASYEGRAVVIVEIEPAVEPVAVDVVWAAEREPSERVRALIEFAQGVEWPAGATRRAGQLDDVEEVWS